MTPHHGTSLTVEDAVELAITTTTTHSYHVWLPPIHKLAIITLHQPLGVGWGGGVVGESIS